jgi:methionyl aminopeptidase
MSRVDTAKIKAMRIGGKRLGQIRRKLMEAVREGVTPMDIENLAIKLIRESGSEPSFTKVPGYHWATCICPNDVVVHGIPGTVPFRAGDVVCVDVGLWHDGYHTDTADTIIAPDRNGQTPANTEVEIFLEAGRTALRNAIQVAKIGNHIGHISAELEKGIEEPGYHVIHSLVGHGVGKQLHEPPEIPGFLNKPIESTPELKEGMTIAIEIIYAMGKPAIKILDDGWTIATKDQSLSAVFEHTVYIGKSAEVLTL